MLTRTDPDGGVTTWVYDALNRPTLKTTPDGQRVTMQYDAQGNPTNVVATDSGSTTLSNLTYTYDVNARVTRMVTAATAAQPAATVNFAYDGNGNRISLTTPDSRTVAFTYDGANRLTAVDWPGGTAAELTCTYAAGHLRSSVQFGPLVNSAFNYTAGGRLLASVHRSGTTTLLSFANRTDAEDRLVQETLATGDSRSLSYTTGGELAGADHPASESANPDEAFTYDANGNRTSGSATYDARGLLTGDATYTYAYDQTGRLTQRTARAGGAVTTYTYDGEGRLARIQSGGAVTTYRYDGFNRRIEKNVGGTLTRYLYDPEGNLLCEYDGAGTLRATFIQGARRDEPLLMERNGTLYYYLLDRLPSVRGLVDSSGALQRQYTYTAFGKIAASTGTLANPYAFAGREYDEESGLIYSRARYYDPAAGRFTAPDPIWNVNLYTYVGSSPYNGRDPEGEFFFTAVGALVGAAVGGATAAWEGKSLSEIGAAAAGGAVSGAIAGAAADLTVATGGAAAVAIAVAAGAVGGAAGKAVENGINGDPLTKDMGKAAIGGAVGGAIGAGAGKLLGDAAGKALGKEVVEGATGKVIEELAKKPLNEAIGDVVGGVVADKISGKIMDTVMPEKKDQNNDGKPDEIKPGDTKPDGTKTGDKPGDGKDGDKPQAEDPNQPKPGDKMPDNERGKPTK
jgi:RHS repeat-associated protein